MVRLACPDGGAVEAEFAQPARTGNGVVVFVHGLGSARRGEKAVALAAACASRGWPFAAMDFRGHGASTGTLRDLRCSHLLEDLAMLQTYLAHRGLTRLFLVGSSMGGWASAWFARRRPECVPACVLLAPALRFPGGLWARLTGEQQEAWRRTGVLRLQNEWMDQELGYGLMEERDQFPMDELWAHWRTPTLIYHGMCDDVIPYEHSLEFATRAVGEDMEVRLLKRGDHRLTTFKEELAEAACQFIARSFDRI